MINTQMKKRNQLWFFCYGRIMLLVYILSFNLFFSQTIVSDKVFSERGESRVTQKQTDSEQTKGIIYITKGITTYNGEDASAAEIVKIKPVKKIKVRLQATPKQIVKKSISKKKITKVTTKKSDFIVSWGSSNSSYSNSTILCRANALQITTGKQNVTKLEITALTNSLWVESKLLACTYFLNRNFNSYSFFYKVRPPPIS